MKKLLAMTGASMLAAWTLYATPIRLGSWNIRLATMDSFLTPGTKVMSHETFGDFYGDNFYPSDHFPIRAVISLP